MLICPEFYEYHDIIRKEIENQVGEVCAITYSEREFLKLPLLVQGLNYIFKAIFSDSAIYYYAYNIMVYLFSSYKLESNILSRVNAIDDNNFDYLLVIKGFGLRNRFYRELFSKVSFNNKIIYQWDTLHRYPLVEKSYLNFDDIFSFQKSDTNSKVSFLPMFFVRPDFEEIKSVKREKYDFTYIAQYSKYRYNQINKIKSRIDDIHPNSRCFFYLYSKPFPFRKNKEFIGFKPLSLNEVFSIYQNSKVMIEISSRDQSAVTQRFFDAIMLNKKIITSASDYKLMDIPHIEEHAISLDSFLSSSDFDLSDFESVECRKYDLTGHEISSWIKRIFR